MDQQTNDMIKNEIESNEVCLFMKGTPDAPQCGFSMAVTNILKILEVNFKSVDVLANQNVREGIKVYSDWPTIPQLYVKNEFVGGCDIIKEMYENGELAKLFETKGINFKSENLVVPKTSLEIASPKLNNNSDTKQVAENQTDISQESINIKGTMSAVAKLCTG